MAPTPVVADHDVSHEALAAATTGIQAGSAGAFEETGPPVGSLASSGVGAGGKRSSGSRAALPANYLSTPNGLAARRALNAVAATIQLAPKVFPGWRTDCPQITPILAAVPGIVMAGNFKDGSGGCYVWLNLLNTSPISAGELCKLTLHELGHLGGLEHSPDQNAVMHSPFIPNPIPPACVQRFGGGGK